MWWPGEAIFKRYGIIDPKTLHISNRKGNRIQFYNHLLDQAHQILLGKIAMTQWPDTDISKKFFFKKSFASIYF